jgi:hypothetical protein
MLPLIQFVSASEGELQNVNLAKSEVINHDYFAAGNTVTVSGTINGDAYIAGGNVTFDGVVNGDLLLAGGNVTILGSVTGDVRAAGGNLIYSSQVDKNATLLGGSISMSDSGRVQGSLVSAGGNVAINSPIGKGANIAGGQITLGNSLGSDVNIYTSSLSLTPSTKIAGDLDYWSEKEINLNPEASISGKTNYHYAQTPKYDEQKMKEVDSGKILGIVTAGTLMFYLYSFIVSLLIGLLLIKMLPVFTAQTVKTLETHPWASIGIGFLTVILFPMLFILLLITIIGIPLAFVLLMMMVVLWFIAETFVALLVGSKVLGYIGKNGDSRGWSLFTGLVVLGILSLIPIINFFVGTATYLLGIGALLIQKKNSYSVLREKNLI